MVEREDIIFQRREKFNEALLTLFRMSIKQNKLPTQWNEANQTPIPKKAAEEDAMARDNYRGVTMRSAVGKLLSRVLINKYVTEKYEAGMCQEQGGFRQNRRCAQQQFVLADMVYKAIVMKKKLFVAFIDLKKAYPSVWRRWEDRVCRQISVFRSLVL
jgi:hypothetical protein